MHRKTFYVGRGYECIIFYFARIKRFFVSVIVCQFCKTAAKKQYIKKVCIKNCSTSHQDIVAGTIEDLSLHFSDIDEFQSFRQVVFELLFCTIIITKILFVK